MLREIHYMFRSHGLSGTLHAAWRIISSTRAECLDLCRQFSQGRNGIEIGGPSGVFSSRGILPLYEEIGSLDNCNFSSNTTWEGSIKEGRTFQFSPSRPAGMQYIAETTNLKHIASGSYDFLLSSHVLEHSANAIHALSEWVRVVHDDGCLMLLIPHKDGTFDHKRPVTTLSHLIDDYATGKKEDDLTHLPEILQMHDLWRDPGAGTAADFKRRSQANLENRCSHHHVSDTMLVAHVLNHIGLQLLSVEPMRPHHIIAIARKPTDGVKPDNKRFLVDFPGALRNSPFQSDRDSTTSASVRRA